MPKRTPKPFNEWLGELLDRRWKWVVLVAWLLFCAWYIFNRQTEIRWFALGDTDDNMRMMQVRGLLGGQGWFDLRQYRLNPPVGANIHWSRLVDLPIAGLILLLRPLIGGAAAERWAVGIAPLLPYLLLIFSTSLTVRRLIDPRAYPLAIAALIYAGADRPPRLAAGVPRAVRQRGRRSAADPRRPHARAGRGPVARDRPRDADL